MNRRNFLKIAGSTGVIVAAGGVGFAATRTPHSALKAWADAGVLYKDPMRRALSYAILAPNPHNRQPWIVDLKSSTEAVLTCDLDRLLPATDPYNRQIVIGLGCFTELFSIAAAEQGFHAAISYFPNGQSDKNLDLRPIAHLSLQKRAGQQRDPLFAHILNRHTNRNPYDLTRAIADDVIARLQNHAQNDVKVGTTNEPHQLQELRVLTRDAMFAEMHDRQAYRESIELMRIGRDEINANPDGLSLRGAFLEGLNLAGLLTRESLADPTSSNFKMGLDMFAESTMSAMGFVWITTSNNDRMAQIDAGRAYMRIALQAAAEKLSMQPMSQALQEYDAMTSYYNAIHKKLTRQPGTTVQMLARLGYSKPVGPAPRWPLRTRIKGL